MTPAQLAAIEAWQARSDEERAIILDEKPGWLRGEWTPTYLAALAVLRGFAKSASERHRTEPLSKDDSSLDYDGSWGDASKGWPEIRFETEKAAEKAYVIAWRDCKIPYGAYVLLGKSLRLQTAEYVERVAAELDRVETKP